MPPALAAGALPALAAAAAPTPAFEAVWPGGDTRCGRGGSFAFIYRPGTANKVVFEFEGGGACWDAVTCNPIATPCPTTLDISSKVAYLNGEPAFAPNGGGMHDAQRYGNPFREWHHIFVPYCTCDTHAGAQDKWYGVSGTMMHRGHVNFQAVLQWALGNLPQNPDAVAATGCSAGSLGALWSWPWVARAYPGAAHYVFGDSYVGVFGAEQYNNGYPNWGMVLPDWIPGFAPQDVYPWREDIGCYLHKTAAHAFPNASVGLYTSDADSVQTFYYVNGGGSAVPGKWTALMHAEVACIQSNTTNEHTFIAAGSAHCRSQDDGFYAVEANGVSLAGWVSALVTGKEAAVPDVTDCNIDRSCESPSWHWIYWPWVVAATGAAAGTVGVGAAAVMMRRQHRLRGDAQAEALLGNESVARTDRTAVSCDSDAERASCDGKDGAGTAAGAAAAPRAAGNADAEARQVVCPHCAVRIIVAAGAAPFSGSVQ